VNDYNTPQSPKLDIVDRLLMKPPLHVLTNEDLCEAAQLIVRLREEIEALEDRLFEEGDTNYWRTNNDR